MLSHSDDDDEDGGGAGVIVRPHPQRVRPLGSRLLSDADSSLRDAPRALGTLVCLPDGMLLQVLSFPRRSLTRTHPPRPQR